METLALITTITSIHLLAVISPGPDFIVACRNALTYSRKTGIWTAVGFGLGIGIHILYSLAGLAILISKSIVIFNIIKFLGAGYLIYIGWKSFTAKGSAIQVGTTTKQKDITPLQAIKIGFLTNVLNPKATLFFLSLFTMVIAPNTSPVVLGVVSCIMIFNTMLWFSTVALLMTHQKVRHTFERFQSFFNKTLGGLLIALGIKVAMTNK